MAKIIVFKVIYLCLVFVLLACSVDASAATAETPTKSEEPVKAKEPTKATETAKEQVVAANSAKSAEPVKAAEPEKVKEPEKPAPAPVPEKAAEPAKKAKPATKEKAAKREKPAEPPKKEKPVAKEKAAKKEKPAKNIKPTKTAKAAKKKKTKKAKKKIIPVVKLTEANFYKKIGKGFWFIKFYAPWCGHCNEMAPAFKKVGKMYAKNNTVHIGEMNCDDAVDFCTKPSINITGYPTLLWFADGLKKEDYPGPRNVADMKQFIEQQLYWVQLEKQMEEESKASPEDPKKLADTTEKTSKDKKAKPKKAKKKSPYQVVQLTESNFYKKIGKGFWFIKFYAPWCGHCSEMAPAYKKVGDIFAKNDSVNIGEMNCDEAVEFCTKPSINITGYPTLLWFADGLKKESYPGPRNVADMTEFIDQQLYWVQFEKQMEEESKAAKEKEPAKKEELVKNKGSEKTGKSVKKDEKAKAKKETPNEVIQLAEDNFVKLVSKGFWFIKFYAPWCMHCTDMAPAYKKVGDMFAKNITVNIGELNCDEAYNLCTSPKVNITGYPTLSWFADGKKIEDYPGPRKTKDMIEFINMQLYWVEFEKQMEKEKNEGPYPADEYKGVLELSDKDWNQTIPRIAVAFVHFFTKECVPCQKLSPTWEAMATEFEKQNALLVKVDCTANKATCQQNKIKRYPTLQVFKEGKMISDYKGVGSKDKLSVHFKSFIPAPGKDEL